MRFDHCCDLFRGFVSKYQVILTKYSPGARESTDLYERKKEKKEKRKMKKEKRKKKSDPI